MTGIEKRMKYTRNQVGAPSSLAEVPLTSADPTVVADMTTPLSGVAVGITRASPTCEP